MKLKDILTVGSGFIKNAIPNAGIILDAVNQVLPADKKLTEFSGVGDLNSAVHSLPDEKKSALLEKDFDLQIVESNNWRDIMEFHAESEKTGNSTRPNCALLAMYLIGIIQVPIMIIWFMAAWQDPIEAIKQLKESWELVLAMIAVDSQVVMSYFGKRTVDKHNRLAATSGQPLISGVGQLAKMFWGR